MRRPGEAGFTLVEVMVALLIFGMIAAAGVAVLSFSVRAQGAATAKLDDVAALNRLEAVLSADLAQALVRPTRDEGGARLPAFVGTAEGVALVRGGWTNLDAEPRPGIQRVAYRLAGDRLERISWPMPDGAAPLPPAVLLEHVRAFRLRYRLDGAWSDRWDGAAGAPLPQAAEVTLARTNGVTLREMFLVGAGYAPQVTVAAGAPG